MNIQFNIISDYTTIKDIVYDKTKSFYELSLYLISLFNLGDEIQLIYERCNIENDDTNIFIPGFDFPLDEKIEYYCENENIICIANERQYNPFLSLNNLIYIHQKIKYDIWPPSVNWF